MLYRRSQSYIGLSKGVREEFNRKDLGKDSTLPLEIKYIHIEIGK